MARDDLVNVLDAFLQVENQKLWIKRRGGNLSGYIATYGSKDDPNHSGDGAEAILAADHAHLEHLNFRYITAMESDYEIAVRVLGDDYFA